MPTPQELEAKFKSLGSDRTMMLGLDGVDDGRPADDCAIRKRSSPIYFTVKDNELVKHSAAAIEAIATFASKDHEVFATVHGQLSLDMDRATIDRLWNRFVAAWYEGGKDDPKLALLRLDAEQAQIWLNDSSLFAGVKLLLGVDPKKDYKKKVAEVSLD